MKRASTSKARAAVDELENVFKALADKTRLRILALLGNNEVCVCHLHDSLGRPATDRLSPSRVSAQERARGRPPRRRVDALPGVEIAESRDSRRRRGCGGRVAAAASHDAGPKAVSTLVRAVVRARQPCGWRVLCASRAGIAAMIESPTDARDGNGCSCSPFTHEAVPRNWSASSWRRSDCSPLSGAARENGRSLFLLPLVAYITGAYWFTASTSFANPAVTVARALTDTFAGIRPADVPGFIGAQLAGAATATLLFRWLVPSPPRSAERVVVPRSEMSAS